MPHYKDLQNKLHFLDSSAYASLLPVGSVQITDIEAATIRAAAITSIPLAQRQASAWERIKAERDRRVQDGGYLAAGHWYHSDTFSRTQQLGLLLMGANIPVGLQWKTMDDGFVTMTPTLANQIFAAAATSDSATFTAAVTHQTAMMASLTPETYTFATGWPAIFGG